MLLYVLLIIIGTPPSLQIFLALFVCLTGCQNPLIFLNIWGSMFPLTECMLDMREESALLSSFLRGHSDDTDSSLWATSI